MAVKAKYDALMKNPNFGSQSFSSRGLLTYSFAGASSSSVVATSFAIATPFAYRAFLGNGPMHVAYCDAGAILDEDICARMQTGMMSYIQYEALLYPAETTLAAFHWKKFALTSLSSFLLTSYLRRHLEGLALMGDEDDDFPVENSEKHPVYLDEHFKKLVKPIIHGFITLHNAWRGNFSRIFSNPQLARLGGDCQLVHSVSALADPLSEIIGHLLRVVASRAVQVGLDIYQFFNNMTKSNKKESDDDATDTTTEQAVILGKKVCGATVRCVGSLIFSSIGAGIGATLICSSTGLLVGYMLEDKAGQIVIEFCFKQLHWEL